MKTLPIGLESLAATLAITTGACTVATTNPTGSGPRADAGAPTSHPLGGGQVMGTADGGSVEVTGPAANACAAAPSDDGCSACLKSNCCPSFAACLADPACVALVQCGNNCATGDTSCVDQCTTSYTSGQSEALAVADCEEGSCASACSGATPPPSSASQSACLPDTSVPSGAPDCAGLTSTPVERDCPFGSPDPSCVPAPNGSTNVFCCPSGTGPSQPSTGGTTPPPGSAAYVDPQAVGLWENSNSTGVDYTNGSGSYSSPSGNKAIFQFAADGQFLFEVFEQASLYSCTEAVLGRETGTVNFHGNGFTLAPATATVTSQDSCNASNNYEKPWQNQLNGPFEYTWSVGSDPNGSGRRMMTITYLGNGSMEMLLEQPSPS